MKWAALVPPALRPAILNTNHDDWWWILKKIPRSWTAWFGSAPRKLTGNADPVKPIPDNGEWWFGWPLYFAITTKDGWHIRVGLRWDDVDGYYNLTFITIKRYK